MINKRGQFIGLYLVVLTLVMVGISLLSYISNNGGNVGNAIVSPKEVLKIQTDLEIFEILEKEMIEESLNDLPLNLEFGSEEFISSFRGIFMEKFLRDEEMKEFIFSDLYLGERNIEDDARLQEKDFLENTLYPEDGSGFENGEIKFSRWKVSKKILLKSTEREKINFPVLFSYEFEKEYFIRKNGDDYLVIDEEILGGNL